MNVLDLFSGIGGFSLGLERAGMRTVAFCEINQYARAVLQKHWPDVPIYDDVTTLTNQQLTADGVSVDIICGGFPCQDISVAGNGAGLAGARSGLWSEFARLISEIRPQYAIVENVSALLGRGIERVLGDLAEIGYDAEWHCIPASAVGAPHQRDRVWIVAYPSSIGCDDSCTGESRITQWPTNNDIETRKDGDEPATRLGELISDANYERYKRRAEPNAWGLQEIPGDRPRDICSEVADAIGDERIERGQSRYASSLLLSISRSSGIWELEPDVGRVVNGISSRVDRLKCLGNAVVPQIPEIIGRAIMNSHAV